ncbi:thiamine biosynthesis membrane-associated lipoprotein [Secundilactobacillus odoratitofui DSM 19909 = JCM 15043]|uniref:FAD:protein FMN transferase n=1 Tax=Secundilactobacillus odoratitofui DSM 19909 = JCM 15043 TaxID=1423776 RepID=A0A0R1LRN8_9LACO|nr:FAD:protein FMN transferase [Secundilactobacillus odoratitofui]KRK98508.1 thiamine biosynthesis membrane-associated lipoprotein [Secundilactobacillus odoratitofui DSM 19909 = JCM 15043]
MPTKQYQLKTTTVEAMTMPFTIQAVLVDHDETTAENLTKAISRTHAFLQQIDRDFSPFKANSLVTLYQHGGLKPTQFTEQFQEVYGLATLATELTNGAFSAHYNGHYDPTGLVKGWAIQRAFEKYLKPLLELDRIEAIALNGAGDIQMGVADGSDYQWHVGIEDPADPQQLLQEITIQTGAMATSGFSKRGQHIKLSTDTPSIVQATIIASELIEADIMATTAIAMGLTKFQEFTESVEVHGLLVDQNANQIAI